MKKSLLLISALGAAMLLAGCGGDPASTPATSTPEVTSTPETSTPATSSPEVTSTPESSTPSSTITTPKIDSINAPGDYDVAGVVTAVTSAGFVIDDGTGSIYVFVALPAAYKIGDAVNVSGSVVNYYGLLEFDKTSSVVNPDVGYVTPEVPAAVELTADMVNGRKTYGDTTPLPTTEMRPVKFTLPAKKSGNYTNFYLDGVTENISPMKLVNTITFDENVNYEVEGYLATFNTSSKYFQFIVKSATAKYDAVASVNPTASNTTVNMGSTIQLNAGVLPVTANPDVTWASADETIATIDAEGIVTPVKAGKVNMTATSVADTTKSGSIEITVVTEAATYASLTKYDFSTLPEDPTAPTYGKFDNTTIDPVFLGTDPNYMTGGDRIVTDASADTCYKAQIGQGPKILGLKIGGSKGRGILTLTLNTEAARVALTVTAWSASKLADLSVNDGATHALTDAGSAVVTIDFAASKTVEITSSIYSIVTGMELFKVA